MSRETAERLYPFWYYPEFELCIKRTAKYITEVLVCYMNIIKTITNPFNKFMNTSLAKCVQLINIICTIPQNKTSSGVNNEIITIKTLPTVGGYDNQTHWIPANYTPSENILCMRPTNERRRYNVTSSPIGWAHTQNDPCSNWCLPRKMQTTGNIKLNLHAVTNYLQYGRRNQLSWWQI